MKLPVALAVVCLALAGCGETAQQKNHKALEEDQRAINGKSIGETEADEALEAEQAKRQHEEDEETARETRHLEHEADARKRKVARLLRDHGAVGMSASDVRHALGSPDHTQEIAGETFWYYSEGGAEGTTPTEYQLIISDGAVSSINRY